MWSERAHSRYVRRVSDEPVGGQPVTIVLAVRRFYCRNADCVAATFVEQVEGLSQRRRRSVPLLATLAQVGLALAGRAGARPAAHLGIKVDRTTRLRWVRALPEPELTNPPTVLGVGDSALRRGHVYGTGLVDISTGKAIDVLDGREAEPLAQWLRDHPGAEVICRDRAGAYAEGAKTGAPDAIQVADRFHLWRNLGDHVEKAVARHRGCFKPEPLDDSTPPAGTVSEPAESRLVTRARERYAAVQDLPSQGASLSAICRILALDRKTVRRFARAATVDELLGKAVGRSNLLDPFKPYLHQRWSEGATDAAQLTKEISAQGYAGRPSAVTCALSARCSPHPRRRRSCPRSAKSPAGCCAAPRISTKTSSVNSRISGPAVQTWTASQSTARHSPP